MKPFDLQQRLSDLIAFQCSLVALRGVGAEASEEMLWQTLLAVLVEQYGFARVWYGQCAGEAIRPAVAAPSGALDLPETLDESSPLLLQASLDVPIWVDGRAEGRLFFESAATMTPERAEQLRILSGEASTMIAERRSRMRTQRELQAAKLEAENANSAKSMLLANMSHEIRTPMNAVLGFTELLFTTPLSAEQQDYVETIHSSGQALLTLINDILDFSKITAGKLELESLPIDLRSVADKAMGLLAIPAGEKHLRLSSSITEGTPPVILGDAVRVQQILVNLLSNAVKFTTVGEVTVEISGSRLDDGRYCIEFRVRDTGPGIPHEIQKRLFESYSQADSSISRKFGGTGLGLAISRSLTQQMGGRMWVESEPGHGACFYCTILTNAVAAASAPPIVSAGHTVHMVGSPIFCGDSKSPAMRVVVAEDNPVNRELALIMLRRLGVRADAVANGAELLERMGTTGYDLVLMDMQMPEIDGLEAARRIRREWPPDRQPRIVAMTAAAFAEDRVRCMEAGMDDYVSKPISADELMRALSRAMPTESATDKPEFARS